jgi:two-component system sensor histidine kinase QseC
MSAYLQTSSIPDFMFQIWSNDGKLLLHSANSATISLKDSKPGLSDLLINDVDWRVFSGVSPDTHTKVVVAEIYDLRNNLTDLITRNNGTILLLTYPLFAILIWLIVGFALRSVTRVTNEISNRASTYLEPVATDDLPIEIKPLVVELNQLFLRLKLTFDRNKRFAADAAHELRTPLAALKTQAQVALRADNEADRQQILLKVVKGVDRSSHVVGQLLTLSRLSQEQGLNDVNPVDLHKLATEIIAYLVPIALEKNIDIELAPAPPRVMIRGNDTALGILIRNIVDNAIRYTPEKGAVNVSIINEDQKVIFRVVDTGPGIPIELRERVFERFYRMLGTTAPGSGLGLAIVSQIANLHHAQLILATPPNGIGVQFDVAFPTL